MQGPLPTYLCGSPHPASLEGRNWAGWKLPERVGSIGLSRVDEADSPYVCTCLAVAEKLALVSRRSWVGPTAQIWRLGAQQGAAAGLTWGLSRD